MIFKHKSSSRVYKFLKVNKFGVTGLQDKIDNFKNQLDNWIKNSKSIDSKEILKSICYKINDSEYNMMNNYLYYEFGWNIEGREEDKEIEHDEDGDEILPQIIISGFQYNLASKHIYNHPLWRLDKLMNRIYPEYWIEADELEKNEYAHKIIQISDKKNSKLLIHKYLKILSRKLC